MRDRKRAAEVRAKYTRMGFDTETEQKRLLTERKGGQEEKRHRGREVKGGRNGRGEVPKGKPWW